MQSIYAYYDIIPKYKECFKDYLRYFNKDFRDNNKVINFINWVQNQRKQIQYETVLKMTNQIFNSN